MARSSASDVELSHLVERTGNLRCSEHVIHLLPDFFDAFAVAQVLVVGRLLSNRVLPVSAVKTAIAELGGVLALYLSKMLVQILIYFALSLKVTMHGY